jgi:hypothetical protein
MVQRRNEKDTQLSLYSIQLVTRYQHYNISFRMPRLMVVNCTW